jgi:hypothetical protein
VFEGPGKVAARRLAKTRRRSWSRDSGKMSFIHLRATAYKTWRDKRWDIAGGIKQMPY